MKRKPVHKRDKLGIAAVVCLIIAGIIFIFVRWDSKPAPKGKVNRANPIELMTGDNPNDLRPAESKAYNLRIDKNWSDTGVWVSPTHRVGVSASNIQEQDPFILRIGDKEREATISAQMGGDDVFYSAMIVAPTTDPENPFVVRTDTQEKIFLRLSDKATHDSISVVMIVQKVQLNQESKQ